MLIRKMLLNWKIGIVFVGLWGVGCASQVPVVIRIPPPENPSVAEVRADVSHYMETQVRWGGTITAIQNGKSETSIEVISHQLDSEGRPKDYSQSEGRFIAKFKGFLDPAIYSVKQDLTIFGTVSGIETHSIGEFPYQFPVITVDSSYLWKPRSDYYSYERYNPWFYGPYPYYGNFYGYYGWPYGFWW
ncbi:Slp family lipoprotein [Nitrosococcus oceani]|uniref:Membrane protein n=1 Tax=Nitrosococcus oceani C-27 TaxID=314279 RepID=A0A0E2ZN19_9GAMM|nr:Slp family lipoprotein [Nitrosococcus oceani]KFI19762.1 membrane protein [Nitrosococcus oceani C-27]